MSSTASFSRRRFLKGVMTATAASYVRATSASPAQAGTPSPRGKLFQFRYSDVKLTGGPLKDQFDRIHAAYMALDEDRVLKVYRQRAGLPAPGEDMGGWYDAEAFAPGHSFGQYVSGLARFADATGDEATRAKVKRLVDGFTATIDPDGYSYPSLKASTAFPAYTLDKNVVGLLDAYQFAGVAPALDTAQRIIKGGLRYLPPRAIERDEAPRQTPYDESYTLPENLFYTYELTGDKFFLELARQYLMDRTYFEPLARGINVLPGRHAYSHVNAMSSAARAYLVLGAPKHLEATRNAWDMLEQTQQFASGGWGPNEAFVEPSKGLLGESLKTTHAHFETPCGAYAHFKLGRYLLRFTGEARYGDGIERVLYNTVLGARDPKADGQFFYYSDYHSATQKGYFPDKWPCCSGTLPQAVADYLVNSYFRGPDGVYVNLFVPSELHWKVDGAPAKLIQSTSFPESDSSELRLELSAPAEFTVYVRIPGWLQSPAELAVNEKAIDAKAEPRTFAAIRRRWQDDDTVQIRLPFSFRTEPVDVQHRDTVALMRGPLLLVALDPSIKLPAGSLSSHGELKPTPHVAQSFQLEAAQDKVRFVPFYLVKDETYTTYVTAV
ncbi:MAG: hypothetical protein DMG25_06465 [Acidobacteria bacterium]|nr:MAG: hypothetical protein DMG25_06465 [Acidobacteriota bacterium]